MSVELGEIIGDAIMGALGLGMDFVSPPKQIDLVGSGSGTGVPNVCIGHFFGDGDSKTGKPILVGCNVNCNGDIQVHVSELNPTSDTVFTFTDDRIGTVSLGFEAENCCNNYPWPGNPWIKQDTYSTRENGQNSNQVGLRSLVPETGNDYNIGAPDCSGDTTNFRVGTYIINNADSEEYAIAFPWVGKALGCP